MSANDLILLILVAAGAFYAGYQVGRLKALAEIGAGRRQPDDDTPLPGPLDRPSSDPVPPRPRAAPPPTSAGDSGGSWANAGGPTAGRIPPRRSTKPPPAAAGLMGTGEAEKSGQRQK